jgi:hypothetical protein
VNHWVSGICPSYRILDIRKNNAFGFRILDEEHVQKPRDSDCYAPSTVLFRFYLYKALHFYVL